MRVAFRALDPRRALARMKDLATGPQDRSPRELWRRLLGDSSTMLGAAVILFVLGLGRTALLTKNLELSEYKVLLIVPNLLYVIALLGRPELRGPIYRFFPEFEKNEGKGYTETLLALGLLVAAGAISVLTLIIVLVAPWIGVTFYDDPEIGSLLRIFALPFFFMGFDGFAQGVLRCHGKFRWSIFPQVIGAVVSVGALWVYFSSNSNYELRPITMIMAGGLAIGSILPVVLALKLSGLMMVSVWRAVRFPILKGDLKRIIWTTVQSTLVSYLKLGSDRAALFVLGVFATSADVVTFGLGLQLLVPFALLQNNLQSVVSPEITRRYARQDYQAIYRLLRVMLIGLTVIGLLAIVGWYFLGDWTIRLIADDRYLGATGVVNIQIIGSALMLISLPFFPLALAMDRLGRRNLVVSIRIVYIFVAASVSCSAYTIAWALALGSLTTRIFNDLPLGMKLKKLATPGEGMPAGQDT